MSRSREIRNLETDKILNEQKTIYRNNNSILLDRRSCSILSHEIERDCAFVMMIQHSLLPWILVENVGRTKYDLQSQLICQCLLYLQCRTKFSFWAIVLKTVFLVYSI